MPKSRQQKEQIIKTIKKNIQENKITILASFEGLTVADLEEFRQKAKARDTKIMVVKKTLLQQALKESNIKDSFSNQIFGNLALVCGLKDEVSPAKVLKEFTQKHPQLQYWIGILNNQILTQAEINTLANIPSQPELFGQLVYSLKGLLLRLVYALNQPSRSLINVLQAIKTNKS